MERSPLDRRLFLRTSLAAAVAAPLRGLLQGLPGGAANPCDRAAPTCRLAGDGEPGEPLHVAGTIFGADGATPAPRVVLYAYQTDATGHYGRERGAGRHHSGPRLRGWMRTAADGRYEFFTIRPVSYPGSRIAAHVHTQLWGDRVPPQEGPEMLFEDDPLVSEDLRRRSASLGRFAFIPRLERGRNGVWQATLDIRVKTTGDRFDSSVLHGARPYGIAP